VHALIAAQQAAVDGLLAEPHRSVVPPPQGTEPTSYHLVAPRPAIPATTVDAAPGPEEPAAASPRRPRRTAALVTAGAVAAAGIGVGAYLLLRDPNGPPVPDKYLKAPVCAEAAAQLPLPASERKPDEDRYLEQSTYARINCSWYGSTVVAGQRYRDQTPSASVQWELQRSAGSSGNATQTQRKDFTSAAKGKRRDNGLGIGDEAYWDSSGSGDGCSLSVRDGNLSLSVGLGGKEHPAAGCEAEAVKVARAALAAMPR
jgi:hypothetical protein